VEFLKKGIPRIKRDALSSSGICVRIFTFFDLSCSILPPVSEGAMSESREAATFT